PPYRGGRVGARLLDGVRDRRRRSRRLGDLSRAPGADSAGLYGSGADPVQPAPRRLRAARPGQHRRGDPRGTRLRAGSNGRRQTVGGILMTESTERTFSLTANHVGIGVSDLSRSIAFYRDLLGFNVAYERGEVTAEYMPRLVGIPGARLKIAGLDIPGLHL